MSQHTVLIAYATRYGSTTDVAEVVADVLRQNFAVHVDVQKTRHVQDVSAYDCVILGSSIINDRWLPEMDDFIDRFIDDLKALSCAFFITSGSVGKGEHGEQTLATYIRNLQQHPLQPVHIGVFGGHIDFNALSTVEKYVTTVKKLPAGDYRDWSAIRAWADVAGKALLGA